MIKNVRIGSFNTCKLSVANLTRRKKLNSIIKLLDKKYDLIALQEVMDIESVRMIANALSGNWDCSYERPRRMRYGALTEEERQNLASEGYAFLWNRDVIDKVRIKIPNKDEYRTYEPRIINQYAKEIVCDRKQRLIRNPYYGRFAPRGCEGISVGFEIRLINAHIIYSKNSELKSITNVGSTKLRRNEFLSLAKSVLPGIDSRIYGINPDNQDDIKTCLNWYTILCGDYNLNLDRIGNPTPKLSAKEEQIVLHRGHIIQTVQEKLSSLKQKATYDDDMEYYYASNYDHFTYDVSRLKGVRVKTSREDLIKKYYGTQDPNNPYDYEKYYEEVSDHVPVKIEFTYGRFKMEDSQWTKIEDVISEKRDMLSKKEDVSSEKNKGGQGYGRKRG